MKSNELVLLEGSYKIDLARETKQAVYWVTLCSVTKKVSSRYGPFDSISEAKRFAKEHHINFTNESVSV